MKFDHDWLMMVMGKLMRQFDRGLISRKEFDDELWWLINHNVPNGLAAWAHWARKRDKSE